MSLTPSNNRSFFQSRFTRLDECAQGLKAELEALRDHLTPLTESFAIRVEQVTRTATEIREQLRALADELGRDSLAYSDRRSLEGVVDALLIALKDRGQVCERLQRNAVQLEAGRFTHRIKARAAHLNTVRQQAAAELRQASQARRFGLLQGPEDGSDWLTWAWQLEPHRLDQLMELLQPLYPKLAELLPEAERWQPASSFPALPTASSPAPALASESVIVEVSSPVQLVTELDAATSLNSSSEEELASQPALGTMAEPLSPSNATPYGEPITSTAEATSTRDETAASSERYGTPGNEMPRPAATSPPNAESSLIEQTPEMLSKMGVTVLPKELPIGNGLTVSPTPQLSVKRVSAVRDLVWRMLRQDRPGLAYHLANCLHQLVGASGLPPRPTSSGCLGTPGAFLGG